MMGWAEKEFGVRRFVASVSPANMPSLKIIAHFGFTKIGEALDETDGLEHIFLRDTDSPA